MLPRLPTPGSANGPPVFVVILATEVKNDTSWVMGSNEPAPVWKEPVPLSGRHTPTSSSPPHSAKLGVQGSPLLQFVVPVICHPPTIRSSARLELPANVFPLPKGSSYTALVTQALFRTWSSGPHAIAWLLA